MALAPLGFVVDTSPVQKAVADLDKLTSATAKAQAGTKSITAPTAAAATATRQLGSAATQAATQMTLATNAVKANNAALAITNAQARATQQQMRNLAFQFQDIGTMLVAGQSPFMLLAQQLPQVTMYGGRLTGVMGALKTTLAGLFSPLGLLTTGFVLAGSAAMSYFTSANDEADKAAEILADQESLIESVADRWGDAIPALREYANAIKEARDAADLQTAAQIMQNSQLDEIRRLLPEVNAELSRFSQQAAAGGWGSALEDDATAVAAAFDEVYDALVTAAKAIEEGEDATDALKDANDALARLLNGDAIPAVGGLSDALGTLAEAYGVATEAAQEFNRQQATAAAREANAGRFDKTGQRVGEVNPLGDNEFLSRFGWDNVIKFPRERRQRRPRKTDAERAAENYDKMLRQSEQFIASQMLERDALYMTEEAAAALRYEQEMLFQAANDNVQITPELAAEIRSYAVAMADAEAETTRLQKALQFGKDLVRGFVSDLRSGLEQGKGFWRSFGDAAMNVLDRIVDKLLNNVIDALFQVNRAGSGLGGIFSSLFGGLFGGGGGFPAAPVLGGGLYAKGGVFGPAGQIHAFANGGVVNGPTVFPFANGVGLMGEAGPEAIMPLRRGPDGRLGVEAANQNGGGVVVRIENYGTSKNFEVQQIGPDEVRVIAKDEIAQFEQTLPDKVHGKIQAVQQHPRRFTGTW